MHRGARRESIYHDQADCILFLGCLEQVVERFGLEVHVYALMPNHYHLLVRSVTGNLSRCMQHLNGPYAQGFNKRRNWDGPVFRGRFRNQVVNESKHLETLVPYIHLNPVRAGLVPSPEQAVWSSYAAYIGETPAPGWLRTDVILSLYGDVENLVDHMQSLHAGSIAWPSDFDLNRGVFKAWDPEVPRTKAERARARQALADEMKNVICDITEATWTEVCKRRYGPGGNPRLRFAAWVFAAWTDLTHTRIGELLGIEPAHVGLMRGRAPDERSPRVREWMARFRLWKQGSNM